MKPDFEGADHFFWRTISQDSIDNEKITSVYTGINGISLNPVVRSNFTEKESSKIIHQIKLFYEKKNIGWCWYLSPKDNPTTLPAKLEAAGLKLLERAPKMSLNLGRIKAAKTKIIIKEITNQHAFKDWAKAIREGFGGEDDFFAQLLARLPFGPGKPLRHYVAYHQNKPVSSCTLSLSRYGARIDNMATVTRLRRKGFGSAILQKALWDAQQAGVQHCYLDSSEDGLQLYAKAGFKILGEQLTYALPE